ncbi:MAG TPA: trimethylamine methyltransferase family protein [Ilumatobacter sp.]|nr:trimethylamine methyltransferase family protein [Ilumatobacter sp.]
MGYDPAGDVVDRRYSQKGTALARRKGERRLRTPVSTAHYRHLVNPFDPLRILSDDQVAHLHTSAVNYLRDEGIRVTLPEARTIFAEAGAIVDDALMVRLDPDMVNAMLAAAPSEFTIHSPNGDRDLHLGGRNTVLLPAAGPPFVSDLERGRRTGTFDDYENFIRLIQSFDVMGTTMPVVEASDIPINVRHLHTNRSAVTLSDKVPFVYCRGRRRVRDSFDLMKIRFGIETDEEFASRPRVFTTINTNSPRLLDVPMALGIIDFARLGQPVAMTPFTLAGAMAPVTMAGALVLQHMEAIAAITLSQLVRPGTPVMYGAFTSNVDMKSGSPAFGTPEAFKGAVASGQLARHIGIPWRSSGSSASNTADAQAGYETMINTFGAIMGGANWILHAAGWQEGGLVASYEKFILDIEMCQILAEMFVPVRTDGDELALDAITDVGPGGHFFGTQHTLDRFEHAFYQPIVFSRANFEQWTEDGALDAQQRASLVWKQRLADFEAPEIADDIVAELDEFVERRSAEGGAEPD